jgi:hypothetical protein
MCSQAIDQNIFPKVLGTLELFPVPRKLYTEPFIGASYQMLVHFWLPGFRGEGFLEITRNKNCLWWQRLLTDWHEMNNLYTGPSIDASYQVSFIWPSGFRGEDFS